MAVVERAKTDRSSCRACGGPIAKGEARLGRWEQLRGQSVMGWTHMACVGAGALPASLDALDGWAQLRDDERALLLR